MELEILRSYHRDGTNGKLYADSRFQCYTIELPWKDNQPQVSCIPEGRYELKKRCSQKFGQHLLVTNVKDRELILLHPANDALKELRGCIAPVSILNAPGKGSLSRIAFTRILDLVSKAIETERVFLTIKKISDDHQTKSTITHTSVL